MIVDNAEIFRPAKGTHQVCKKERGFWFEYEISKTFDCPNEAKKHADDLMLQQNKQSGIWSNY
jgi:hypothetical protein